MSETGSSEHSPETEKKSFARKWGSLIAFGTLIILAPVTFRLWTEYQENQPIASVYQRYLDHLASISSQAANYQDSYHRKLGRQTIASKHFLFVCGAMTRLAEAQGAKPGAFSPEMADACRRMPPSYEYEPLLPVEGEPPVVRTVDPRDLKQ